MCVSISCIFILYFYVTNLPYGYNISINLLTHLLTYFLVGIYYLYSVNDVTSFCF